MRPFTILPLTALVLGSAGAGCKSGDRAPDCKAVGAAYASLQQREIEKGEATSSPGAPAAAKEQKEQALSLIPVVKEAIVKECEQKKWQSETRRCVVAARTPEDLESCRTDREDEEPSATGSQGGASNRNENAPQGESGKAPEGAEAPETTRPLEKPGSP